MNKTNGQPYMSEPLTTHEIEDVLSSIRRLVSEDLRPVVRPAVAAAADAGKLLLTPALRIVPDVAQPVVAEVASVDALPMPELAPEPQAAAWPPILLSDDDYEDEGLNSASFDDAVAGDVGLVAGLVAVPDAVAQDALQAHSDAEDELIWSAPGEIDAPMTEDLDMVSAPETVADTLHEAPGHWTAQDVPGVDWVQEETDWVEPEPMAFVAHPRNAGMAKDPLARAWADRAEAEVHAQLGGQGLRPSVKPPEPVMPESVMPEPAMPEPAMPEPAMPEPAMPEPNAAPQSAEKTAGPGLFDGDDAQIDEETLREIVRDIIREELAGALGERITRNVRKLVRVEINRALTAREFE